MLSKLTSCQRFTIVIYQEYRHHRSYLDPKNSAPDFAGNRPSEYRFLTTDDRKLEAHFRFGENWRELTKGITESHVRSAIEDITRFSGMTSLAGKTFLDIGCGSGLSSVAAARLGASVSSVDIDPLNIENTNRLLTRFAPAASRWKVWRASILDAQDFKTLPMSDLVYSWGVLHHTGDMWTALANAASLVNKNGHLYLMLYRDARLASVWRAVKRAYTKGPAALQFVLRNGFAAILILGMLAKGKNPMRSIRRYAENSRGMSWYLDIVDWVGGYPFEWAAAPEVVEFLRPRGFELVRLYPPESPREMGWFGTGSYQYLFRRV